MFKDSKSVVELTPFDFGQKCRVAKAKKYAYVLFYANWCGHCHAFKDTFERFAKTMLSVECLAIDCASYPDLAQLLDGSSHSFGPPFGQCVKISGYPTIYFYKDGYPLEEYTGLRTYDNMVSRAKTLMLKSAADYV